MRSQRFTRVLYVPALVLLIANATPASAGDTGDGTDPAMLAGTGLLIISGSFAIGNADYVAGQSGNYVLGTLGMLVGAPVAGIGALALLRSLEADEIEAGHVLMSTGLVVTGLAAALLGGMSVSNAISPPDKRIAVAPALVPDARRLRPGIVLSLEF